MRCINLSKDTSLGVAKGEREDTTSKAEAVIAKPKPSGGGVGVKV